MEVKAHDPVTKDGTVRTPESVLTNDPNRYPEKQTKQNKILYYLKFGKSKILKIEKIDNIYKFLFRFFF